MLAAAYHDIYIYYTMAGERINPITTEQRKTLADISKMMVSAGLHIKYRDKMRAQLNNPDRDKRYNTAWEEAIGAETYLVPGFVLFKNTFGSYEHPSHVTLSKVDIQYGNPLYCGSITVCSFYRPELKPLPESITGFNGEEIEVVRCGLLVAHNAGLLDEHDFIAHEIAWVKGAKI
ncbi:MAG: hypothetical protein JWM81_855 [Candidatus Saccharibacteria bacterium]|nr:hypothetical protein [Candidatus Saccharibacteria bacterium]